jgi:sterol desaturase/sphingolipid hydroxylase (fatty acid hydroxylase superfamily)
MNSDDYFLMDILYTGDELANPTIDAKIVDIKGIEIRSKLESSEKEQVENLLSILAGFLYVVVFLRIRMAEEYLPVWRTKRWENIVKSAYLFFVVMGSFMFYMGVWRIASQLKYENSLLWVNYFVFVTIILSIIGLILLIKGAFFPRK